MAAATHSHLTLQGKVRVWDRVAVRLGKLSHTLPQVGHTHNQLDGSFGNFSMTIYGKRAGGTTGLDVLSFSAFEEVSCLVDLLSLTLTLTLTLCRSPKKSLVIS